MRSKGLFVAVALCATASGSLAQTVTRVRGVVVSLEGNALRVASGDGSEDKTVALGPKTTVTALVPSSLEDVRPGSFIGTAAQTQADGTLVAREVHVFPETMRGTGEGHSAFDLGPKSTMTNGTVGQEVTGTTGRSLTVKYKGGEKTIVVPPGAPVVTFVSGDRAELTPGAHIIVFAQRGADGSLASDRVVVGRNGLTPPM